jgi:hypothetical protein
MKLEKKLNFNNAGLFVAEEGLFGYKKPWREIFFFNKNVNASS